MTRAELFAKKCLNWTPGCGVRWDRGDGSFVNEDPDLTDMNLLHAAADRLGVFRIEITKVDPYCWVILKKVGWMHTDGKTYAGMRGRTRAAAFCDALRKLAGVSDEEWGDE